MLGFSYYDMLGAVLVYAYIGIVFLVVEKLWKGDRAVGRKILHIGMGNIVFILAFFTNWYAEVLIAGSALLWLGGAAWRRQRMASSRQGRRNRACG